MQHRHLLPDEIDLLVDGEVGFGVAPLQAHVESCAQCRRELEQVRGVVAALERVPELGPSALFASRVMSQVQVFEPWHVPVLDAARRFLPSSTPTRVLAGSAALLVGAVLSVGAVFAAMRLDDFLFVFSLARDWARGLVVDAVGSAIAGAFGQPALDALRTGSPGVLVALSGFLVALLAAGVGLRVLVGATQRRRP